jgi:hypothetical protein
VSLADARVESSARLRLKSQAVMAALAADGPLAKSLRSFHLSSGPFVTSARRRTAAVRECVRACLEEAAPRKPALGGAAALQEVALVRQRTELAEYKTEVLEGLGQVCMLPQCSNFHSTIRECSQMFPECSLYVP